MGFGVGARGGHFLSTCCALGSGGADASTARSAPRPCGARTPPASAGHGPQTLPLKLLTGLGTLLPDRQTHRRPQLPASAPRGLAMPWPCCRALASGPPVPPVPWPPRPHGGFFLLVGGQHPLGHSPQAVSPETSRSPAPDRAVLRSLACHMAQLVLDLWPESKLRSSSSGCHLPGHKATPQKPRVLCWPAEATHPSPTAGPAWALPSSGTPSSGRPSASQSPH